MYINEINVGANGQGYGWEWGNMRYGNDDVNKKMNNYMVKTIVSGMMIQRTRRGKG